MELEDGANIFSNEKFENDSKVHKRYVCAVVEGESEFIIDDYPKLFGEGSSDIWVIRETPAGHSATGKEDEPSDGPGTPRDRAHAGTPRPLEPRP